MADGNSNSVSSGDENEVERNDSENLRSRSQSSESEDSDLQSPKSNNIGSPQIKAECKDGNSSHSEMTLSEEKKHKTKKESSADLNDSSKHHEIKGKVAEEQFDYEAEDGECSESEDEKSKELEVCEKKVEQVQEDLEEGEIVDDDDGDGESKFKTIESRTVCRFFMRGQCSWGVNCRFFHPEIAGNGNAYYERGFLKQTQNFRSEEFENGIESSSEIRYTRHPPTRSYSPEKYTKKQIIYEPEYSRDRERSSSHYYDQSHRPSDNRKYEDRDLYKSKRPKREVSGSREKEGWSDPWMRSKSSAGAKRKRNDSSSSYSSRSSSRSSSTSRSSYESPKKRSSYNREKRNSRREIKERAVPVSPPIRRNSLVDEFGRSRKKITAIDKGTRRGSERKRSIKSVSRSSSDSSSSSDSDSSPVSKTRSKRGRTDTNLKNDKVSKQILINRLKNIESAIANYQKKSTK